MNFKPPPPPPGVRFSSIHLALNEETPDIFFISTTALSAQEKENSARLNVVAAMGTFVLNFRLMTPLSFEYSQQHVSRLQS